MLREPFYLLLALPLLAVCAGAYQLGASRRRALARLMGDKPTLDRLIAVEPARRRSMQTALRLGALAMLTLALAGPQWGVELVETRGLAPDVVIAVDVSLSMMAEDVKPNRLARAKEELSLLIDELKGARVGVIAFAGEPVVVCPLTTDTNAAKQLLRALEPGSAPVPGTGIGKTIRRAAQQLARYPGNKSLVLLTDGEDHHTDPVAAAQEAAAEGVRIFTIGIGTTDGEPIPLKDDGGRVTGFKKDKRGTTVVSRLGEADLAAIAEKTGGAYFRATPGAGETNEISKRALGAADDAGVKAGTSRRYRNRFLIPAWLAFVLLLIELLIPETAAVSPRTLLAALALLLCVTQPASAASGEAALRRGNSHYDKQQYEQALEQYSISGKKNPKDRRPVFNAGDALYRLEQYDKAAEAFDAVAKSGGPRDIQAQAYYNLGDAFSQKGDYKEAVNAFRKAVALAPSDEEARRNLAVALRHLKEPPKKDDKNKKDQNQQKKDQPQPQPKPQDQPKNGQQPPPQQQPKTRPQDQISKEDAERIMRAVSDREKAATKPLERAPLKKPNVEEDW